MSWVAAAIGTANMVGGIAGHNAQKRAGKSADSLSQQAMEQFKNIDIPGLTEQEAILEQFRVLQEYNPEMAQALVLDPSAMEQIGASPDTIAKQKESLDQISEIAEGGFNEADKAGMRQVQRQVSQNAKARRDAILSNMDQRGVLGSGMELAAQLKGEQQSVDQQSQAGDKAIQQAQARALQAMTQKGNLASGMRGQEFGEQESIARAKDAVTRFNLSNRQKIDNTNVDTRNQAQLGNMVARQKAADANVSQANREELRRRELKQSQFDNEMSKARGMSGQLNQQARNTRQAGANEAGMYAGIGNAVGDIAGSLMGSAGSGVAADVKKETTNDDFNSQDYWDKVMGK